MTTARPSGWDICCAPGRHYSDFDPEMGNALITEEVYVLLKQNQTGIDSLILMQLLLLVLWMITTLVPGFALYDGPPGEVSAVSHISWWAAIEIIIIYIGAKATTFGLHYSRDGQIEKGADRSLSYLWFYRFVLFIGAAANVTHGVLSILELSACNTTFCTNHQGFLIAFVAGLFLLVLIEAWQVYRTTAYMTNLKYSLAFDKNDVVMLDAKRARPRRRTRDEWRDDVEPDEVEEAEEEEEEEEEEGMADRVGAATPLLQNVAAKKKHGRHGRKFK